MAVNINENINLSNEYNEKIEQLKGGINVLLDEFKKIYIITKMNPSNQEYQQQFQNIVNSLAEIFSKLFTILNDVQVNIDDINKKLFELNILITKERDRNKELKRKLGMIENTGNASSEMINNYKDIYNMNYLRNWSLLLSSLLVMITISIIYKKSEV
jgi:methyl-accepting chemotaxis protein